MFTVLIVSDDNRQIHTITDTLKNEFSDQCVIVRANTPRDVHDFLHNIRTDVVLLDMDMDDLDCIALPHQFRQVNPDCVILMLAELQALGTLPAELDLPVMDYLVKPYSRQELILTLEETFHLCTLARAASSSLTGGTSKLMLVKEQIESYIQANYAQILSMQDVAQAMNYSETHFCRLFKQCFHINFSVYLNEFRVKQAKKLLVNTNLTVKEVSISCGYRDTSYFIRVFKRFTGTTPSDYRISKLTMTAKKSNKS